MSKKCRAYSESRLGLEPSDNRKAFYAGWDAALREALSSPQPAQQDMPKIGCVNHDCDKCKAQQQQEPATWMKDCADFWEYYTCISEASQENYKAEARMWVEKLRTSPPASKPWVGLTDREVELLDGMIEVQLDHAKRCDSIANRPMAEKQKAWDMERVELLRKLKAAHGIKGGA